jgi:hypothetical protein
MPYSRAPTPSFMNISRSSNLTYVISFQVCLAAFPSSPILCSSSHFPTQSANNYATAAQFTSSGGLTLPYGDFSTDSAYARSPLSLTFSGSHHYESNPQIRNRTASIVLPDLDAMSITPLKSSASARRRRASTAKPTSVNNEYVRRLDEKFCPVSSSLIGLRRKRSLSKLSSRQSGPGTLPPLPPLPPLPLSQPISSKRKPAAPANLTAAGYGPISQQAKLAQLPTSKPTHRGELPPLPPLLMSGSAGNVRTRRSSSIKPESALEDSLNSLDRRSSIIHGSQGGVPFPDSILSLNTAEAMLEFHRQRTSSQTVEMRRSFQPTSPQRRGLARNTSFMSGFNMPNTPPQAPLESTFGMSSLKRASSRTRAKNDQCSGN